MSNYLANVSTQELKRRLAGYQKRSDPAAFAEGDAIVAELKLRAERLKNDAACAEALRSDPNAADRFSLSI